MSEGRTSRYGKFASGYGKFAMLSITNVALRCFVWVISIHFLNIGVVCIKIRNVIVENHIQA